MVSRLVIPSLQQLDILHNQSEEGNYRLKFKSVITYLRTHGGNSLIDLNRPENIRRTFQKVLKGYFVIDNEEYVTLTSFLRYVFLHYDKIEICQNIVQEIEKCLLEPRSSTIPSILSIYRLVAQTEIPNKKPVENLHETYLDDDDVPTLYKDHRKYFSTQEWEKIKFFEWHFWRFNSSNTVQGLENEIAKREQFLRECESLIALQPILHNACKETIKLNSERKAASRFQSGILLTGHATHIPSEVDFTILNELQEVFPDDVEKLVCVPCQTPVCSHEKGLHVYLELRDDEFGSFHDMCIVIKSHITTNHNDLCPQVVWLKSGTLMQYGESIQRFHLHDDWILGTLKKETLSVHVFENGDPPTADCCAHCWPIMYHKYPLDWNNLVVINEWNYHVPLLVQLLFGAFVNQESVRRTANQSEYVVNKMQRLYSTFDILLNILNRCYLGIYQQVCSDELSLSYHSVNTVFSVTSQGGVTCSYTEAERRLKRQADPTVLYYKAYIDKYSLRYDSDAGTVQKSISLRDCHLILCLDNLVRLTFHNNSERGDARTSQICTLPITLMGVPKDAVTLQSWHDISICDGSNQCKCKESITLTPADVERVLLNLNNEERLQMDFFQMSITWGLTDLWKSFENHPEVSTAVQAAIETRIPPEKDPRMDEINIDVLSQSVQSLELEESFFNNSLSSSDGENDIEDLHASLSEVSICSTEADSSGSSSNMTFPSIDLDLDIHSLPPSPDNTEASELVLDQSDVPQASATSQILEDAVASLGFKIFRPPPLLCRHPPPVEGRDDDPKVLKKILRDILLRTGNLLPSEEADHARILFAPDNKIGRNLFKIMASDETFRKYLPEFPLLHLRKSKILNFCSAYEDAGLYYLLSFMQDRELEMKKLVSLENIEDATRNIRRISFALHLAFIIKFLEFLSEEEGAAVREILFSDSSDDESETLHFHEKYLDFLKRGSELNGTFALHKDIMFHCDEILMISVAERIGGPDGYNLLLAAVKSSLPFSFLNGASSYAAFCCNLLHEHYSAGCFHDAMKKTFFSTPYKGSQINFALDCQREMDHREAIKGFRPRGTSSSVLPRMSLVDAFTSVKKKSETTTNDEGSLNVDEPAFRTWKVTKQDIGHIVPTTLLVLRQGALSLDSDVKPRNVYAANKPYLTCSALDSNTMDIGVYLVRRFAHLNGLCGLSKKLPSLTADSPKELVSRVKNMKEDGFTVRRMKCTVQDNKCEKDKREIKRQRRAKHLSAVANCLTSDMNTCQAVVRPDCTKPSVNKAAAMKNAVLYLLGGFDQGTKTKKESRREQEKILQESGLVKFGCSRLDPDIKKGTKTVIIEFAGVKFKSAAVTGKEYLKSIECNIINRTLHDLPNANHLVICEEKYQFTPDDFKASARAKRKRVGKKSIVHLKRGSEIISKDVFDKKAACLTSEGKALISTFLASNVEDIQAARPVTIDIDSEWIMESCECEENTCSGTYSIPIRTRYGVDGIIEKSRLGNIHQRKGEAEMAQIDWLMDALVDLQDGDSVLSMVTSGDIDAVPIHMFSLSEQWPRRPDGSFRYPVFVCLKKLKDVFDVYNVTRIIEVLDSKYGKNASMKFAVVLCMGGNDFMLKFHGIPHEKMVKIFLENKIFLDNLIEFSGVDSLNSGTINKAMFKEFIKELYCPPHLSSAKMDISHVRQLSIKHPGKTTLTKPQKWMPPSSALDHIASLIDCQIKYLFTAGNHSANLPDFLQSGCLKKGEDGQTTYFLGDEVHTANPESLLLIPEKQMKEVVRGAKKTRTPRTRTLDPPASSGGKRGPEDTPQKGQRRKRKPKTSTPRKALPSPVMNDTD